MQFDFSVVLSVLGSSAPGRGPDWRKKEEILPPPQPVLPEIPEGIGSLDPTAEVRKPWYKTTAAKIVAGALVVAAGLATTFMMLPKGEAANTARETSGTPSASAPVGEKAKTSTGAQSEKPLTIASLELPASLTPEQLGSTFIQERLTQWGASGQTDANRNAWLKNTQTEHIFIENTITNSVADTFADALLVSNWRDITALRNWVDRQKGINTACLELWFRTYKSGLSEDVEPYESGSTVALTTVISQQTAGTMSIAIHTTEYDNASKNRAVKLDPNVSAINGNRYIVNASLQLDNGHWKISTLEFSL